jgi:L-amino acid N-acyltransferase YncA
MSNHHSAAYPRELSLNGTALNLRLLTPADREALLTFGRALPEQDLFFLRTDITKPEVVDDWLRHLTEGTTLSIVAESGGQIAGYANLHYQETRWTRHLGEVRLQVSPAWRGKGLGKRLAEEVFKAAEKLGLKKLVARMASGQMSARGVFERLGFQPEALLADAVIDDEGRTQDLILMSYDVTGFMK